MRTLSPAVPAAFLLGLMLPLLPAAQEAAPVILERGPHHRVETWTERVTESDGSTAEMPHTYTVLATGMHYLEDGEWKETVPEFVPVPGGFLAARGPHQVLVNSNLFVAGAVTVVASDGAVWKSTPMSLAVRDRAKGEVLMLAESKASAAQLVAPGTVLFPNAFDGVAADVRVVYTAAGVECDVILRERLPAVAGLNPATSEVIVLTEVFDSAPTEIQTVARPDAATGQERSDAVLKIGSLLLDRGSAFGLDESGDRQSEIEVPVFKSFYEQDGRRFLEEATPVTTLEVLLQELPEARVPDPLEERWRRTAGGKVTLPARRTAQTADQPPRNARGRFDVVAQAQVSPSQPSVVASLTRRAGVVLDWSSVNTGANQTFSGDTTYYVTGAVNLSGTVTYQPGTVIKYAKTGSPSITVLSGSTLKWLGEPYLPVVLTARDDDSVGETLPDSNGAPYGTYAVIALAINLSGNTTVSNVVVRYADNAIQAAGSAQVEIRHGQLFQCNTGLKTSYTGSLRNVLAKSVQNVVWNQSIYSVVAEHLTVNGASYVNWAPSGGTLTLNNCLLVAVNYQSLPGTANLWLPSVTGIFQTVGKGAHYLGGYQVTYQGVPYQLRNAGTDSINASLKAELAKATTFPPIIRTTPFTSPTFVSATAWRDEDKLDLGYHYWPIDHAWSDLAASAELTFTNGVVVAHYGINGTQLQGGAKLVGEGRPNDLNRFCWYSAVQDLPEVWGTTGSSRKMFYQSANVSPPPKVQLRFTAFGFQADTQGRRALFLSPYVLDRFELRDCQIANVYSLFSPGASTTPQTFVFFNNLWRQSIWGISRFNDANMLTTMRYNLTRGCAVNMTYTAYAQNPVWIIKDNFFESGSFSTGIAPGVLDAGYNGYTGSTAVFGGSGNVLNVVTTDPTTGWQTGPLGGSYYPNSGLTGLRVLANVGSQSGTAAGLYHHTTTPDQTKEEGNNADIGFHYVATSGSSSTVPKDTDGEGLADYVEDQDGDGTHDTSSPAEFNWQDADTDPNDINDRLKWELSYNILVNDPAQDLAANLEQGDDGFTDDRRGQNSQFETSTIAFDNTVIVSWVDTNRSYPGYGEIDDEPPAGCAWQVPGRPPEAIGWAVSRDGGLTFVDKGAPPKFQPSGANRGNAGDPVLARHDKTGIVYLIGTADRSGLVGGQTLYLPLWRSLNNGDSFESPANLGALTSYSPPNSPQFYDKPYVVVDNYSGTGNGNVYAAAHQSPANQEVHIFRSTDNGLTWQKIYAIPGPSKRAILTIGPSHKVYAAVTGDDNGNGVDEIDIWVLASGGSSFEYKSTIALAGTGFDFPRDATDPDPTDEFNVPVIATFIASPAPHSSTGSDVLHLVFDNVVGSPAIHHARYARSLNGGTSWETTVSVDTASASHFDRWCPALAVRPDGKALFAAWYDRRSDGQNIEMWGRLGTMTNPQDTPNWQGGEFALSSAIFPPVFCGSTHTAAYQFDPCYPPIGNCPDSNGNYIKFVGEYDLVGVTTKHILFSWSDARDQLPNQSGGTTRHQRDVRIIKTSW